MFQTFNLHKNPIFFKKTAVMVECNCASINSNKVQYILYILYSIPIIIT